LPEDQEKLKKKHIGPPDVVSLQKTSSSSGEEDFQSPAKKKLNSTSMSDNKNEFLSNISILQWNVVSLCRMKH
jgi:hypothetical protein